ncbi:MAG: Obg family GTPase CgtA, partial [Thermus sp.]|nr:Obg family GTPase CgtA [Thermus sp.]
RGQLKELLLPQVPGGVVQDSRQIGLFPIQTVFKGDLSEAAGYLQEVFRRHGVEAALRAKGVRAGDIVRIGEREFEYIPG